MSHMDNHQHPEIMDDLFEQSKSRRGSQTYIFRDLKTGKEYLSNSPWVLEDSDRDTTKRDSNSSGK